MANDRVFGKKLGVIPINTRLFICRETTVGFAFSKQRWYQVAYGTQNWSYGWVAANRVKLLQNSAQGFSVPSVAFAQSAAVNAGAQMERPPMPPAEPATPGDADGTGSPDVEDQNRRARLQLYGFSFLALLLGITAKVGFDTLNGEGTFDRRQVRKCLAAVLVSPMAFLTFIPTLQAQLNDAGLFVVLLFAFQAGFFWQTVLARGPNAGKEVTAG
ncbi:MAG TPA: hypothetical protein VFB92_04610 [Vicinamibacterales bacterium]|nr:hypothetical protein [Vicinamibacterales bacterium]